MIDDDKTSRYLAQIELAEMSIAKTVVVLATAREALDYMQQHCLNEQAATGDCADLILLDLSMPGMDGFDFMEALQQQG